MSGSVIPLLLFTLCTLQIFMITITVNDNNVPSVHPCLTWTRVIEYDLCPTVPGLHSAWHRAQHRSDWRSLVETATLQ